MPYEVRAARPDPTLDVVVSEPGGDGRRRMTVLNGVVAVAPIGARGTEVRGWGREPEPEPGGFFVPGAEPVPTSTDVTVFGEAFLTQVVVVGNTTHDLVYGVGEVAARLVIDERNAAVRWPYLGFVCFGQRPLAIRYRVTLLRPAD